MKRKLQTIILFQFHFYFLFAQNPISPPGNYLADPSVHIFKDGRLYIYGSNDISTDHFCSNSYNILTTSDMSEWVLIKDIFMSSGPNDQVPYNNDFLFASDCVNKNDTFYLYYCQPNIHSPLGVAVSSNPAGPFSSSKKLEIKGANNIDPSVFIDDDGESYFMWGQFSLRMAKLKNNMIEIDSTTIHENILTEQEHKFHEGAYMTKRKGLYYIVYTDISRADMPTCIGYATSKKPFGPYTYRGVIIDNDLCNSGNWNNHGSIGTFNGQWYVFYHRSTYGSNKMRKTCAEKISFNPDGSIPEVEMTSQGASGPLKADRLINMESACIIMGNNHIKKLSEDNEYLTNISGSDKIVFKYIDFGDGADTIVFQLKAGIYGGKIALTLDKPWSEVINYLVVDPGDKDSKFEPYSYKISTIKGVHALWLEFMGDGNDLFSIDSFYFK